MDELKEQINKVPRSRLRRQYLTKRRVQQYAKDYADLYGINDHGKSAENFLHQFNSKDQIEILRCFEEQIFPELYEGWFVVDCYMDAEKERVANRRLAEIFGRGKETVKNEKDAGNFRE